MIDQYRCLRASAVSLNGCILIAIPHSTQSFYRFCPLRSNLLCPVCQKRRSRFLWLPLFFNMSDTGIGSRWSWALIHFVQEIPGDDDYLSRKAYAATTRQFGPRMGRRRVLADTAGHQKSWSWTLHLWQDECTTSGSPICTLRIR